MFKLFTDKISSVFTTAFQGLTKLVGSIVDTVITTVDFVVDSLSEALSPVTETLTKLPVLGETIESTLTLVDHLVTNTSETVHTIADELQEGHLLAATQAIFRGTIDNATDIVGQVLVDASGTVQDIANLTSPLTHSPLGELPIIGEVLNAIGETANNLTGLIAETGVYTSDTALSQLGADLILDPIGTVGGVLQDVSGIIDNLVSDIAPITDLTNNIPVAGTVVDTVEDISKLLTDGLYTSGALLDQLPKYDLVGTIQDLFTV